jgi:hypothetical protein
VVVAVAVVVAAAVVDLVAIAAVVVVAPVGTAAAPRAGNNRVPPVGVTREVYILEGVAG